MTRFVRWLFWTLAYAIILPKPKTLDTVLRRGQRTWWPWRKFKPCARHNDIGGFWEVYLADDPSYTTSRRRLIVDLHISRAMENVVGFDVYDSDLKRSKEG